MTKHLKPLCIDLNRINGALSSTHHRWIVDRRQHKSVLELLREKLPSLNSDSWATRAALGGIFLNGAPVGLDTSLPCPCSVEYYEPRYDPEHPEEYFPRFSDDWIVYQDDGILVVYKPSGLPSQATREQNGFNLRSYLEKYIGSQIHMPSRLDTSAEGLVIVATKADRFRELQQLFEQRRVSKFYLLGTSKAPEWKQTTIEAPIGKSSVHAILRQVDYKHGQSACTRLYNLGRAQSDKASTHYLLAEPITGRTHQIRLHSASLGLPLTGDNFYYGTPAPTLHLLSLVWRLPALGEHSPLQVSVPEELAPEWAKAVLPRALEQIEALNPCPLK